MFTYIFFMHNKQHVQVYLDSQGCAVNACYLPNSQRITHDLPCKNILTSYLIPCQLMTQRYHVVVSKCAFRPTLLTTQTLSVGLSLKTKHMYTHHVQKDINVSFTKLI